MNAKAQERFTVKVKLQGDKLGLRLHADGFAPTRSNGNATRGVIKDFSRKSRKRLMDYMATLNVPAKGMTMITLTYPREYPSPSIAKAHLDAFLKRIKRQFPDAAGFWRLEFQKRGAPHFHLLMVNLPYWDKSEVAAAWGDVIHVDFVVTRIEHIRSKRGCYWYMSKYVCKSDDTVDLTTGHNSPLPVGRVWGVHNKAKLDFHAINTLEVTLPPQMAFRLYRMLARAFAIEWPHCSDPQDILSISTYAPNANEWFVALRQMLEHQVVARWEQFEVWGKWSLENRFVGDVGLSVI